ncbi:unnamed protein product [Prorocentrum cordatum]|uniref:Endonuclease/exonuclease/phosphatase domain-containing protein n=1 Tax=Prorocentrum cordatum TaxID=2364126 RepID=A0ABN9VFT9_9DINO|nr:unnamed protein product [Polarella glacialis]
MAASRGDRSGLSAESYEIFRDRAICMAYRKDVWNMLSMGHAYVAADKQFGKRAVQFMRVQHKQAGKVIFFVNHHGPIPVDTGGICGGKSVAYEMLQLVKTNAQQGDAVIILGDDFNANPTSEEIVALDQKLSRDVSEKSGVGSLDHIYSNLPGSALGPPEDIGSGGSDHNALSATYKFGSGEPLAAPALDVPEWAIGEGAQETARTPRPARRARSRRRAPTGTPRTMALQRRRRLCGRHPRRRPWRQSRRRVVRNTAAARSSRAWRASATRPASRPAPAAATSSPRARRR